jgi:hypothetical protein
MLGRRSALVSLILFSQHCLRAALAASPKPQAAAPVQPPGTNAAAQFFAAETASKTTVGDINKADDVKSAGTKAAAQHIPVQQVRNGRAHIRDGVIGSGLRHLPVSLGSTAIGSFGTASGNIAIAGNSGINRHGQKDDNAQPRLVRREPSSSDTDVAAASEAARFSGASVPAALLDIGSDRQAQGVNSEQGVEEVAVQSTPGNVIGWVMEMGACKRKGNKDPIPIEDDRRLSQGGIQAKNVKKCADLCEASGACAAFSTSADTIGSDGPVDFKFFAGIHYGNLESGRLCYLNQKWAISAGYLPAPPPPPPSLVNPDGVPGLTGEPGEPGKDGKDLQKSSDNKPKIIFVCLLNLVLTYWLFARLNKMTANDETAGAAGKKESLK